MQHVPAPLDVDPPYDGAANLPEPVPETKPQYHGDLWRFRFPWVKTAVSASPYDDLLIIENHTGHLWMIWHRYHSQGSIMPYGELAVRLDKAGLLTARQYPPPPAAEHLLLDLSPDIARVAIADISGDEGYFAWQIIDVFPSEQEPAPKPTLPIARSIEDLYLSTKIENALKRRGILTLDQLTSMKVSDLAALKGLSAGQRRELVAKLVERKLL